MKIESNTFGKLNKIREGTVFSNEFIFVKEFLQNAQRSKAKSVHINVSENEITFFDNGIGCKNPQSIFTLDKSDWTTTDEGFGMGFWSCLAFEELISIVVASKKWVAKLDVENLFLNEDLSVTKMDADDRLDGFYISLRCNDISYEKIDNLQQEIISVAKYLNMDVYLNGRIIEKLDIFAHVSGEYSKYIDNRYFTAKLCLNKYRYTQLEIFYDRRYVCDFYGGMYYVYGVIEPKKGKLTLKEPDRADYVIDSKCRDFEKSLRKEIKKMYIEFLKENSNDDVLDEYSEAIDYYLDVEEYSKYIMASDDFVLKIKSNDKKERKTEDNQGSVEEECAVTKDYSVDEYDENTESLNDIKNHESEEIATEQFDAKDYKKDDSIVVQKPMEYIASANSDFSPKKSREKSFKSTVNGIKNMVWVSQKEVGDYSEEISLAEYCNLVVIKAKNILHEKILKECNKLHISDLRDSLVETHTTRNIGLRNNKEETFIKLLMPVCRKYNLSLDTFSIANLAVQSELFINNKSVYKEIKKNTKDDINICAVCTGRNIYFDRNYLKLSKFSIKKDRLAISELNLIMYIAKTLAHELAHYFYGTTDNTLFHYQMENKLHDEIVETYTLHREDSLSIIQSFV